MFCQLTWTHITVAVTFDMSDVENMKANLKIPNQKISHSVEKKVNYIWTEVRSCQFINNFITEIKQVLSGPEPCQFKVFFFDIFLHTVFRIDNLRLNILRKLILYVQTLCISKVAIWVGINIFNAWLTWLSFDLLQIFSIVLQGPPNKFNFITVLMFILSFI